MCYFYCILLCICNFLYLYHLFTAKKKLYKNHPSATNKTNTTNCLIKYHNQKTQKLQMFQEIPLGNITEKLNLTGEKESKMDLKALAIEIINIAINMN
jgi:hypothetical protein